MSHSLRRVDYFYVMVPNRAGQGAKILSALASEGVNLLAFSGFPSGAGKGQLDLVPENSAALTSLLGKLADAKISVTAVDAVTAGRGRFGAIFWVKQKSVGKAARLLGA